MSIILGIFDIYIIKKRFKTYIDIKYTIKTLKQMTNKLFYLSSEVEYLDENESMNCYLVKINGIDRLFGYHNNKTFEQTDVIVDDELETEATWEEVPEKIAEMVSNMESEYPNSIFN